MKFSRSMNMKPRTWMWTTLMYLFVALTMPSGLVAQSALGLSYKVLYTFTGETDGAIPFAGVVQDAQGNLYGATQWAGDLTGCVNGTSTGCGVVYKVSPNGAQTVLHAFTGGTDGAQPEGTLLLDPNGNLYGTAYFGGDVNCIFPGAGGCGVIFKIDSQGNFSVLHTFEEVEGAGPIAGLVRDSAGNLYGNTTYGGANSCGGSGCGVVFELDPSNNLTVLYSFAGKPDGQYPTGRLTLGTDGKIYGTTFKGGTSNQGTVFKLSPNQDGTWTESVLHSFNGTDGSQVNAGVIRDDNGNLYGAAAAGGAGSGVVFKIDANGNETTLYSFAGGADGGFPYGDLVRDQHGNLYGTTFFSLGFKARGVVYKLDLSGKETVLYAFGGQADGGAPYAGLFRDLNGVLYGTTGYGGDLSSPQGYCGGHGCGVVFRLSACHAALCQGGGN